MTLFSTKTDSDLSFVYLDSTAAVIQRQSCTHLVSRVLDGLVYGCVCACLSLSSR